jgi:hypothetical protein
MRQFNQDEINAVFQAEQQLRATGLIVDEADGKEEATHNANRIEAYFDLNKTTPVTVQTVLAACEQMRDQMKWKSAAQMEYDKIYSQLTSDQQNKFGGWWFRQKNVLVLDGDEGFQNATKILNFCRGRAFSDSTFSLAVSNLAGSHGLHFIYVSTFKGGKHSGSDASFMSKSDTNLSGRDHAVRRAAAASTTPGNEPPATDYRKLAEQITTGRTHSDSLRISKFYVNKPGSSEIDWEQTYLQRRRIADGKGR